MKRLSYLESGVKLHFQDVPRPSGNTPGGSMWTSRRQFFQALAAASAIASAPSLLHAVPQPQNPTPQPIPSPNAPNPNFPPGLSGPDIARPDQKTLDKQRQAEIRNDVEKLFALVSELKEQSLKTDTGSTLSVSFVKKAQQIEKLAKQIKELAKG